MMPLSMMNRQV